MRHGLVERRRSSGLGGGTSEQQKACTTCAVAVTARGGALELGQCSGKPAGFAQLVSVHTPHLSSQRRIATAGGGELLGERKRPPGPAEHDIQLFGREQMAEVG